MGKLQFMLDGDLVTRNFSEYQLLYPDGQTSQWKKFDGVIGLRTRKDRTRRLEWIFGSTPLGDRVLYMMKAFGLGFLVHWLGQILMTL
ncbi:MAG: hypothetical protein A49_02200 [Methyloceanibacter sp.]|nr:MAG: hypothetical protein A49_02200 [Methyloceanibacter sp.]